MVTVLATPGAITFARNTARVRLRSTDAQGVPFGAKGSRATITAEIASTQGLSAGQTLTLSWTSYPGAVSENVAFVASNTPTASNHLPTLAGAVDITYLQSIADKIAAHFRIAPFFKVYLTNVAALWTITIEVRDDQINDWNPTVTTTASGYTLASLNPVADNTPLNYKVQVEVFWEDNYLDGDFRRVATLEPARDSDGVMEMDFSNIFWGEWLQSMAALPFPTDNTQAHVADNLRRFYFRWTEISGAPQTFGTWSHIDPTLVMWGGVGHRLWANGNYLTAIDNTNNLLHWYPSGKKVSENQPEWLAWFNNSELPVTANVRVTRYNQANQPLAPVSSSNVLTVPPLSTALFPVDIAELGINSAVHLKYEVEVVVDNVAVSPKRMYEVDDLYYEGLRFIQYLNGFGCPETLRCAGDFSTAVEFDRSESSRELAGGYSELTREKIQWEYAIEQRNTYRSGWLRASEVAALQELFAYNEGYELLRAGEHRPISVALKSSKISTTGQNLHSVEFAAMPRQSQGNFDTIGEASGDWNLLPVPTLTEGISIWSINVDFIVQ